MKAKLKNLQLELQIDTFNVKNIQFVLEINLAVLLLLRIYCIHGKLYK